MISHLIKWDLEALFVEGLGQTLCGKSVIYGEPLFPPTEGAVVFEIIIDDHSAELEICLACLEKGHVKTTSYTKIEQKTISHPPSEEERLQCARKKCKNTFLKNKRGRPRKYCGPRCKSK